ncbi:MAG: LysM peptidoglycan-binding domain-containing protein [Actinomycetota bacterium]
MKRTLKNLSKAVLFSLCSATALGFVGAPGAMAAPAVSASKGFTYAVKPGDSLIAIARRVNVSLDELLQVNGFVKSSVIHPGRTIKLPAGATMPQATGVLATSISATSSTSQEAPAPAPTDELPTYTIQAGDSLTRIASKAKVSLEDLLKVNGFAKSTVIHPKQVIKLPVHAAVPSTRVQSMIAFAVSQAGKPYLFGSAGPNSYDCSGLVRASFSNVGVKVPHQSQALAALGTPVDWRNTSIQPGDLVFTANSSSGGRIGHVAIAISATEVVEALSAGKPVGISRMPSKDRILEVRRIL